MTNPYVYIKDLESEVQVPEDGILSRTIQNDERSKIRTAIDNGLAEAEKGLFHGPFEDGDEVASYLKKFKRRSTRTGKTRKPK